MHDSDLIVQKKIEDMIGYGYIALRNYPKSERYGIATDTKQSMYKLLELTVRANKRYHKKTTLQDLDVELEFLRFLTRLAMELGFLPFKQYEVWNRSLSEIGRLIGGWIKSQKEK